MGSLADNMDNWVSIRGTTSFLFRVRACEGPHILLHNDPLMIQNGDPDVSIKLGTDFTEDTMTIELKMVDMEGEVLTQTYESPQKIQCHNFATFWISWDEGKIRMGAQRLGEYQIFETEDPNPSRWLRSLHFVSHKEDRDVEWEFAHNQGYFGDMNSDKQLNSI